MNMIEANLLSLISANRNQDKSHQLIENKTGLNFMDILNSRINEAENFSGEEKQPLKGVEERSESRIIDDSSEKMQSLRAKENKVREENTRKEEKPVENRINDTGKEKKAEEKSVKELSTESKESDEVREKEKILKELEELGVTIEGIDIEDLEKPELNRIMEMLRNMMDIVNPSMENSPLKLQMKNLLSQIKEISENLKQSRPFLKKAAMIKLKSEIARFSSLMEKSIKEMKSKDSGLKNILAKINSILERIAGKGRSHGAEHAVTDTGGRGQTVENTMAILNKIDALLSEAVKENGNGSLDSGNQKDGQNSFTMNFMKNFSGRNISGTETRSAHNSRFSQQMQSIIENAKVAVKDSRNGSFTIKLYPKQLGMVNVNLGLEQGVVHGKFLVENGDARELLMDNLNLIREQLEEAGINIGEFEVNVNHQGEMFTRDDPEETFLPLRETDSEVAKEYDMNSLSLHDGEFNMVI
jgi:flagellar hook-length control protein FliK